MFGPRVVAEPPPGWVATEIQKPKLAESAGAAFTEWDAHRSVTEDAALVGGCVATPIPGWVEDMRPAVEARTVALAGASAAAIVGGPIDTRALGDGSFALRAASDSSGPVIGAARTFVGFDASRVVTCFATCAGRKAAFAEPACARWAAEARLEGSLPPPRPGLALHCATWAVHHPRPTALGAAFVVAAVGVLAVATRRRPRSRMEPQ